MTVAEVKISSSLNKVLRNFFQDKDINSAIDYITNGQVSVSFSKGSLKDYFIISGIFKNRSLLETRLSFRREKTTQKEKLNSLCECQAWRSDRHCEHVSALFIKFYLSQVDKDGMVVPKALTTTSRNLLYDNTPVQPEEYGEIIPDPQCFPEVSPTSTFSSIQYRLLSGKHANFPIPKKFTGSLSVNLLPKQTFHQEESPQETFYPTFEWIDAKGKAHNKISIFGYLYVYNWENGEAMELNRELKDLIRKINYDYPIGYVEDYIRLLWKDKNSSLCELQIMGKPISEFEQIDKSARVSILPSERKNYLRVELDFFDPQEKILPLPVHLALFTFTNGFLSSFKKKSDAYELLKSFFLLLEEEVPSELTRINFKKYVRLSSERTQIDGMFDFLMKSKELASYNPGTEELLLFESDIIKRIFLNFYKCFGEIFFRFSEYDPENRKVIFDVSASNLLSNISAFYKQVHLFGVVIYYNNAQVKTWNARVRFERRNTQLNWFDLKLKLPKSESELLKNIKEEDSYTLTKKGLVLFTPEQKKLAHFIKRYMKYDGTKETDSEDQSTPNQEKEDSYIIPFKKSRIFELFELKRMGLDGALTDEELRLCESLSKLEKMPEYPLPEKFNDVARPYQETGYQWLRFLYENKLGACLADDMGLGKTLQTIMFVQSIFDKIDKVLIVCPVSIIINWQNEFKKFSGLDVAIYYGGNRRFPKDEKIILTSYGVMKKEIEKHFDKMNFDIFVMDEVHHLKNIRSQGAIAARKINADFRIALTGTPVENDLSEFYNIVDLGIPGIWGDLQYLRTISNKRTREVAKKTSKPFILRRTKGQVLKDLPSKIENHIYLNFSDEEEELYQNRLLTIRNNIKNIIPRKRYGEILKGLLELRQLCLWQKKNDLSSTKINFLIENLAQIIEEGHQVLIFSQFTTYLDIIQSEFHKQHWRFSRIDGTQGHKKRQVQIDNFQTGRNNLFLISLKAGGVGLNLTAASYIFLMDPWWNPAVEAQAIDRAHRIGQKNNLTVYRPIIKNSVEEKVLKLQESKMELFRDLLSDEDSNYFSGKLTMKDFEELLL